MRPDPFFYSNKSVQESTDEPNILERMRDKKIDAQGFIGFYSTVPASGLNSRLKGLKESGEIMDYRFFDYKLIENYLIRVGFSELLIRYFPESYKKVQPLHNLLDEYVPLNCAVCGKDLLEALYSGSYNGNVVYVEKEIDGKIVFEDMYWACKNDCDGKLQHFHQSHGRLTSWKDIK